MTLPLYLHETDIKKIVFKKEIEGYPYRIGQKIVLEFPSDSTFYNKKYNSNTTEVRELINDFIKDVQDAIDTFNSYIKWLNKAWDSKHPENMEEGTQLYNDYGHYILDFYNRICHELNRKKINCYKEYWVYYARMIGADPIFAARLNTNADVTIHLEYYDPTKE